MLDNLEANQIRCPLIDIQELYQSIKILNHTDVEQACKEKDVVSGEQKLGICSPHDRFTGLPSHPTRSIEPGHYE